MYDQSPSAHRSKTYARGRLHSESSAALYMYNSYFYTAVCKYRSHNSIVRPRCEAACDVLTEPPGLASWGFLG